MAQYSGSNLDCDCFLDRWPLIDPVPVNNPLPGHQVIWNKELIQKYDTEVESDHQGITETYQVMRRLFYGSISVKT
ncbi:hypothetical protein J6590_094874 [Homalodisca vitripennis]|nr:hypothetical protein J6590_094874 [Homalodisca vitripennis]